MANETRLFDIAILEAIENNNGELTDEIKNDHEIKIELLELTCPS